MKGNRVGRVCVGLKWQTISRHDLELQLIGKQQPARANIPARFKDWRMCFRAARFPCRKPPALSCATKTASKPHPQPTISRSTSLVEISGADYNFKPCEFAAPRRKWKNTQLTTTTTKRQHLVPWRNFPHAECGLARRLCFQIITTHSLGSSWLEGSVAIHTIPNPMLTSA